MGEMRTRVNEQLKQMAHEQEARRRESFRNGLALGWSTCGTSVAAAHVYDGRRGAWLFALVICVLAVVVNAAEEIQLRRRAKRLGWW